MLSVSRKFGESLLIGSVRFTFIGWRKRMAEIMVIRGAAISYINVPEDELYHLEIDGVPVALTWRRKWSQGSSFFGVSVDAPRHLKIYRSELLHPTAAASA